MLESPRESSRALQSPRVVESPRECPRFLFVSVAIHVAKHNGSLDVPVNALAVGISLYTAVVIASGLSGGCINPAIGFVQPLFMRIVNKGVYPNAPET